MDKKTLSIAFGLCIIFLLYSSVSIGQQQQQPKVENPNAASLGVFGEFPVSMFTGSPDISIPIHTLAHGKITVPIALQYNPAAVRPTVQPGWVGLGWNLKSYGMISRTANGAYEGALLHDELYKADLVGAEAGYGDTYYPAAGSAYHGVGSSGSEKVNVSNWDDLQRLEDYFTYSSPVYANGLTFSDVQADEFNFNFEGYSGKFFYSGPTLGWQVTCSEKIKVELFDFSTGNFFLTKSDIFSRIEQYDHFGPSFPFIDDGTGQQSRMFKGFCLTLPDGTKYIFGGPDAVEYTNPYAPGYVPMNFIATNWLLKKIVDVNGNEVVFEYKRSYPTVSLFFGQMDTYFSATSQSQTPCSMGGAFENGMVNVNAHGGMLQWPMYLERITCGSGSLEFQTSVATVLRFTNTQLARPDEVGPTDPVNLFDMSLLGSNELDPANVNNLKWEKLDWIIIKDAKNDVLKKFNFIYQATTTTGQRLTLNELAELNNSTALKHRHYKFFYNAVADLPMYFGNYTDHWGYYNGPANNIHGENLSALLASNKRETNASYVTKGLLTSITFPTGGYTAFTWEPHDYTKVVSLQRNSLDNLTGLAGGTRVSRIQNFSADGIQLSERKYYYKRNYSNGVLPASLSSSGVLNGRPKYYFSIDNRPTHDNEALYDINKVALNPLSNYSYNAQGSHIGYDEVAEVYSDGSYTINHFTNFGPDYNSVSHYDRLPSYIGWVPGEDPYLPVNSVECERGLPVAILKYSSHNKLNQKKVITYRSDEGRFNSFVKRIILNSLYTCAPGWGSLIFATAVKEYSYDYYAVKTEVIDYDSEGTNPVSVVTNTAYNSNNLINEEIVTDSRGVKKKMVYKYPPDFVADATFIAMTNAHILSPVVETTEYIGIPSYSQHFLSKTNYYSPHTGIFVPSNIQVQKGAAPLETIMQFNQYDQKGNLLEKQKPSDVKEVYLYGYSGQYPVAKVVGSDLSTVQSFISQTILNNAALVHNDAAMRTELQKIRTGLAGTRALVTTYTYNPMVGMTSATDPNGRITFYEYDEFGNLIVVKDHNGSIITTYDYHYKQ